MEGWTHDGRKPGRVMDGRLDVWRTKAWTCDGWKLHVWWTEGWTCDGRKAGRVNGRKGGRVMDRRVDV